MVLLFTVSPTYKPALLDFYGNCTPCCKKDKSLNIKFERNHSKLSKTKELDKAPQDDLIQPTISFSLNRIASLVSFRKKIEIDSELISLEFARKESVRKAEAAQKEINKKAKGNQKANYVNRLKPVLEEYEKEITPQNFLARKSSGRMLSTNYS